MIKVAVVLIPGLVGVYLASFCLNNRVVSFPSATFISPPARDTWKAYFSRLLMTPSPNNAASESKLDEHNEDEDVITEFSVMGFGRKRPPLSLPPSYNGRNSLFLFSKSQAIPSSYSIDRSTQENYGVANRDFGGPFAKIRASLDYNYHGNYIESRQIFQDRIVEKLLDGTTVHDEANGLVCKTPTEPWIVFTAGVMGAGKSHTMKQVSSKGLFPLKSYVIVDPDEIRSHFPEYHLYANESPETAGELTHREAGYITEIATTAALQRGYNVLVDGSLRDAQWYQDYFKSLKKEYKVLRIAIVHITAPRDAIFERAKNRAKETGRVVPIETLEMSLLQVPISVKKLAPMVDFFCELDNAPDSGEVSLQTECITWDSFRDNWAQVCPWPLPKLEGKL